MRTIVFISFLFITVLLLISCEKKDYLKEGLPEYANHYYTAYLPNNNSVVTAQRNQTALLKLTVQFYSAYVRDYDVVFFYKVPTAEITNPAVLGQDYAIVDKNGTA